MAKMEEQNYSEPLEEYLYPAVFIFWRKWRAGLMGVVCVHADIQPYPCAGTVLSRTIKCKAGQANTCLRDCNDKCFEYTPRNLRKASATKHAGTFQRTDMSRASVMSGQVRTGAVAVPPVDKKRAKFYLILRYICLGSVSPLDKPGSSG